MLHNSAWDKLKTQETFITQYVVLASDYHNTEGDFELMLLLIKCNYYDLNEEWRAKPAFLDSAFVVISSRNEVCSNCISFSCTGSRKTTIYVQTRPALLDELWGTFAESLRKTQHQKVPRTIPDLAMLSEFFSSKAEDVCTPFINAPLPSSW